MTVNVNEVVRAAVRQKSASGTDIVNVFHFGTGGSGSAADADVLTAIATWADALYAPLNAQIPGSQTPFDIKVDVVDLVGGVLSIIRNVGTISWGSTYNPSGSGESYALGVAIGVILRTLVGKVFGRKFIGQVSETTIAGNALATGAPATAFASFLTLILDTIVIGGTFIMTPGILSTRTLGFEAFVQADLATEVFYQRRRAIRSGS